MRYWHRATVRYLCYGALFGLLFPLSATLVDLWLRGLPLNAPAVFSVQSSQPLHWMIDTAPIFLGLFAALAGWRQERLAQLNLVLHERNKALEQAIQRAEQAEEMLRLHAENAQLSQQNRQQSERLEQLHQRLEDATQTIQALALPLIPIGNAVLVVPLIGSFDRPRIEQLRATLLAGISAYRARVVIFDYTGVAEIAPGAISGMLQSIQALALLGTEAVLTGIKPLLAQQLLHSSLSRSELHCASDLAAGVALAQQLLSTTHA